MRSPVRAASRSTTWIQRAPAAANSPRDAHRVVVVDGLGGEVALVQADAVPAAQVDRREEIDQPSEVPLVDGTPVPSTRTASRSARATPLNDASITW